MLPKGYATIEQDYDDAGRVVAERYFGTEWEAILGVKGYHEVRTEYSENGKVNAYTFLTRMGR